MLVEVEIFRVDKFKKTELNGGVHFLGKFSANYQNCQFRLKFGT